MNQWHGVTPQDLERFVAEHGEGSPPVRDPSQPDRFLLADGAYYYCSSLRGGPDLGLPPEHEGTRLRNRVRYWQACAAELQAQSRRVYESGRLGDGVVQQLARLKRAHGVAISIARTFERAIADLPEVKAERERQELAQRLQAESMARDADWRRKMQELTI